MLTDDSATPDGLPTRESLLSRMRRVDEPAGWEEFHRLYRRLLRRFVARRGVRSDEVDDVVQEILLAVSRSMPRYRYDPARCSFKGWLFHLAEARVIDHYRRTLRRTERESLMSEVERVGDPGAPTSAGSGTDPDEAWDREWRESLLAEAMERVRSECDPRQYRIFDAVAVQGKSGSEVARLFETNLAVVYVARHRVTRRIRAMVRRLERELESVDSTGGHP